MIQYAQFNVGHALDFETGKLVSMRKCFENRGSEIMVPEFMWRYPKSRSSVNAFEIFPQHDERYHSECKLIRESGVSSYDFRVKFAPYDKSMDWSKYERANIEIITPEGMKFIRLYCEVWDDDRGFSLIHRLRFEVQQDNKRDMFHVVRDTTAWSGPAFPRVRGLHYDTPFQLDYDENLQNRATYAASYGAPTRKVMVYFRGTCLYTKSYVMLVGPWGIMMTDDFKFDSLVAFRGAKSDMIDIEKVIYTKNQLMLKYAFLAG